MGRLFSTEAYEISQRGLHPGRNQQVKLSLNHCQYEVLAGIFAAFSKHGVKQANEYCSGATSNFSSVEFSVP